MDGRTTSYTNIFHNAVPQRLCVRGLAALRTPVYWPGYYESHEHQLAFIPTRGQTSIPLDMGARKPAGRYRNCEATILGWPKLVMAGGGSYRWLCLCSLWSAESH